MTEPSAAAPESSQPAEEAQAPASAGPEPKTDTRRASLEDSLGDLDDKTRAFVLGEVSTARTEAKNLRERLKQAEPKISEYDRLVTASKTAEERAQEAASASEQRAATALQRVARAEVKAALAAAGMDDPDSIIEDLNFSKFIDDDGEIDDGAIKALQARFARYSTSATASRAPRPDASQASGGNGRTAASPAAEFASFINQQIRRT